VQKIIKDCTCFSNTPGKQSHSVGFHSCNKSLANTNRPCDCSVLCLHPKSSLRSCPHYTLDLTSHFRRIFQVEGNNSQQPPLRWNGKTRDIPVSFGAEILTDDYFVLSQYTHLTDGRTGGQNCDSNTVRCITCSRTVKIKCCSQIGSILAKYETPGI